MKRKLNILGLFEVLGGIAPAAIGKLDTCKFTARGVANRLEQTPANSAKKAHRKMIQASQRRNRI